MRVTSNSGPCAKEPLPPILFCIQYPFHTVPDGPFLLQLAASAYIAPFTHCHPDCFTRLLFNLKDTRHLPNSPHLSKSSCGLCPEIKMAAKSVEHGELSSG